MGRRNGNLLRVPTSAGLAKLHKALRHLRHELIGIEIAFQDPGYPSALFLMGCNTKWPHPKQPRGDIVVKAERS
jgi:hypothetical protein